MTAPLRLVRAADPGGFVTAYDVVTDDGEYTVARIGQRPHRSFTGAWRITRPFRPLLSLVADHPTRASALAAVQAAYDTWPNVPQD